MRFTDEEWGVFQKARAMLVKKKCLGSGLTEQQSIALEGMNVAALEHTAYPALAGEENHARES